MNLGPFYVCWTYGYILFDTISANLPNTYYTCLYSPLIAYASVYNLALSRPRKIE
jgi:hypothetical protein